MVLKNLTEVMSDRNITVEELAVHTMMSARSITNARRSKGVCLNTGKRIAKALKINLSELT